MEDEPSWGTFPPTLSGVALTGLAGSTLVARGRRAGVLLSGLAVAGLIDEVQNGPRILRRLVRKRKSTVNVVAVAGDKTAPETVVVLAHHDAPQTGFVFDQTWAKTLYERAPAFMERQKKQVPQWWLGILPAVLTALGAITGSRRAARAGVVTGAVAAATILDILRSPTVPGANDNLSGVAVLTGLAESLRDEPIDGVKVMLVSCGAEETFQDGIRAFLARHGARLDPSSTSFLNFDTVGSPHLVLMEGEGPIWMEDYCAPAFRDLIEDIARTEGIQLERGIRARASTDSVIPSRAGYPTATFVSLMPWRMPGNYHLITDVPENIDHSTIADCVRLARGVVRARAG